MNFAEGYINNIQKLKNRRYHRLLNRPEPGPLHYHEHPVRANYISDFFEDLIGFFAEPNEKTWWKIAASAFSYYVMPFVGGWQKAEAYAQYQKDMDTYQKAEMSEDYIFSESMNLFKLSFWSFFNLVGDDNQKLAWIL